MLNRFSRVQLFATIQTIAGQAPLSIGFSRQEYWSVSPCPPASLISPALAGGFFTTSTAWEAQYLNSNRILLIRLSRGLNELIHFWLKINAECESCELSFIWGKMKSIVWETAFQVALRNSSKESRGKSENRWFLWRGSPCNPALMFCRRLLLVMKDFSAFLDMRKCENWAHKIFSGKYLTIWRPVLPVFFSVPHSWSPPWTLFRRCWSQHLLELIPCRLQVPMASANLWVTHRVLKTVLGTIVFFSKS